VSARLRILLLAFVALGGTARGAQASPDSGGQGRTRRIELAPVPPDTWPEVSIRPGIASLVLFDTPLARDGVELEGRERFRRVVVGEDTVALVPSDALREGERLRLTVRFAAGVTPAEARLLLVVARARADTQVEVVRSQHVSAPPPNESAGMAEELQRLREENALLRGERGPSGLLGAIAAPWMEDRGIAVRRLKQLSPRLTGADAPKVEAVCFRASSRVAVKLEVEFSPGERPWSPGDAVLIGPEGRRLRTVQVWHSEPEKGAVAEVRILVEAEATRDAAFGPHILELREAGGARTLKLAPVTFPDL
jgi:uncharacterized protein (TIGR02268 family)